MRSVIDLKYAILGLHRLLKSTENQCVTCRKRKAITVKSIMADLPVKRLGYKQPLFASTGVEYVGPYYVPFQRALRKDGFLFTCLTTRAVHLEVVPPLDTSSCVMGTELFFYRAPLHSIFWSETEQTLLVQIRKFLNVS